ncbi:MAG: YaiO family outer membrane beta-barrel protein [Bacteroidota bacterium]
MKKLITVILFALASLAIAQEAPEYLDLAKQAVELNDLEKGLEAIRSGLDKYPLDHDLRSYEVRILLWQKTFALAEQKIDLLLAYYPDDHEALQLKAVAYWWQEDWANLRNTSSYALKLYQDDLFFQEKLLIALSELGQHKGVKETYRQMTQKNELIDKLNFESTLNHHQRVGTNVSHSEFSNAFAPWTLTSLKYHREAKTSWSLAGTYGNMFGISGTMIESTVYPTIGKRLSGFINASYSHSTIFPRYRVGGELVSSMGNAELAAGARWMNFSETNDHIFIYTAGVGMYFGSFYSSYKAYLADFKGNTDNVTHTLLLRRIIGHRYHYLQLNLSEGTTPLQVNNFSEVFLTQYSVVAQASTHCF